MPSVKVTTLLLSLATLSASAAHAQYANPAVPGTINYIEGQATLNGKTIQPRANATLLPGQVLETAANGKAEVLLTPGVFLRLGGNSAVTMVSPDLTYTEVELQRGRADVEVDQLFPQNDLVIRESGVQTQLVRDGLYEFNAADNSVKVFDGKAAVFHAGTTDNQKATVVKGGHELTVSAAGKPQDFNKSASEDDLYKWSNLRAQYLGEANAQLAPQYVGYAGFAPGWFWDPGLYAYTWLPGDGPFFSPFGYGFYSPAYFGGFGFYGGGFRGGYGGGYAGGFRGGRAAVGGFHGGGGFRR